MSKYTKGPWTMRESNFALHIYGVFKKSKNAFITAAYWRNPDYGASREEAKANAQLIAAAPELLEALRDASQTLAWLAHGKCRGFSDGLLTASDALDKARAAIKKAEGEA